MGAGQVMERVSNSEFKLYATGRRFCSHLNATLSLRKRQDLLSMAMYQINPRPDVLDVEVAMSEGAMPPMVSLKHTIPPPPPNTCTHCQPPFTTMRWAPTICREHVMGV